MIVVDTNVLIYYYIHGDFTDAAIQVHRKDPIWMAPYLWRNEFRNTAMLYLRKQLLGLAEIQRITQAAERKMQNFEFHNAARDVYQLAMDSNCSAYDCEFVALAQLLGVPLITADRRVLRAFPETAQHLTEFVDS